MTAAPTRWAPGRAVGLGSLWKAAPTVVDGTAEQAAGAVPVLRRISA